MRLQTLITSEQHGRDFIAALLTPTVFFRLQTKGLPTIPDDLLRITDVLLGALTYALAQEDSSAAQLIGIARAGPAAILEWVSGATSEEAREAAEILRAHAHAETTTAVWAELLDEALQTPQTLEFAETCTARHLLPPEDRDGE